MTVGILRIELLLPGNNSLKGKRMILKSLKDRIRSGFNVSISEVDDLDKWQKTTLAVASVGNDTKYVNGILCKIMDLIRNNHAVELMDYEMEMI